MRFYLQLVRANFRNPLAQTIVQLTSPLVVPVRRVVPSIGQADTATLLVAYVVQLLLMCAMVLLKGGAPSPVLFGLAIFELARLSLQLFLVVILIHVVLSWVAPQSYNPIAALVGELAAPILMPIKRHIPAVAGIDLSPLVAFILINIGIIIVDNLSMMFVT